MSYLALLARLLYDPLGAVSALRRDRPVAISLVAACVATVIYQALIGGLARDLIGIYRVGGFDLGAAAILFGYVRRLPVLVLPVVFLAGIYVPACLLLLGAFVRGAGPSDTLKREYSATASVALSSWAVTLALWLLPAVVFVDPGNPSSAVVWTLLPVASFVIPMAVGLAATEGAGYGRAVAAALLGGLSLAFLPLAAWFAFLLTSPIVLIISFFIFRGMFREWAIARDARDRLRRNLEAATLNPADADAHLNLGLIYHARGELDRAAEHFERALEIDPNEIDALYQLGRVARERGDLPGAISRFDAVLQLDEGHAKSEIWREVGATYFAAGQFEDARAALERFIASRPWDAEGLYTLGLTLDRLGRTMEAREQMEGVLEAIRTAPAYKYRIDRRWLRQAEDYLKKSNE